MNFALLAQQSFQTTEFDSGALFVPMLCSLVLAVVALAALWRIFTKAGKPGWACIIPIYNVIVLLDIAGKPWWWILLLLIPFVNFIVIIVVYIDLAKNFGQGTLFGLGLVFLSPIFMLLLAFGDAQYIGEKAK